MSMPLHDSLWISFSHFFLTFIHCSQYKQTLLYFELPCMILEDNEKECLSKVVQFYYGLKALLLLVYSTAFLPPQSVITTLLFFFFLLISFLFSLHLFCKILTLLTLAFSFFHLLYYFFLSSTIHHVLNGGHAFPLVLLLSSRNGKSKLMHFFTIAIFFSFLEKKALNSDLYSCWSLWVWTLHASHRYIFFCLWVH